jgi:hypothetical protein
MGKVIEFVISTCIIILKFVERKPGALGGKETEELGEIEKKLTEMRDGIKLAQSELVAARQRRQAKTGGLPNLLATSKSHVQTLAKLTSVEATVTKVERHAATIRGVLSVAGTFTNVLATAGDDAFTRKLCGDLQTAIDGFQKSDAEVKARWNALKDAQKQMDGGFGELRSRAGFIWNMLLLNLSAEERREVEGVRRAATRSYARHGNVETVDAAATATPVPQTTESKAA